MLQLYTVIIIPNTGKQAAHQQVGSSRDASLSKLDNKVNKNPIFNKMHAEFSTIWQVPLLFLPPNFFTQGHSLLCNLLFSVGLFYSIMMQNVVILLLIFGIMLFTEWYRVLVLHLSLLTVFIQSLLDYCPPSMKTKNESRESFDIFVSRILQHKINDPLFSYYFKTLK